MYREIKGHVRSAHGTGPQQRTGGERCEAAEGGRAASLRALNEGRGEPQKAFPSRGDRVGCSFGCIPCGRCREWVAESVLEAGRRGLRGGLGSWRRGHPLFPCTSASWSASGKAL